MTNQRYLRNLKYILFVKLDIKQDIVYTLDLTF